MQPHCHTAREALAGNDLPAFDAHARACGECAAFVLRLARNRGALTELARLAAPAELDGRVVAALEAGHRAQRAVEAVQGLARVVVPEHLDRAVARDAAPLASEKLVAPDVLRRLVEEELSDPSKARARRFVGSLERLEAPAGLAARVAETLRRPERKRSFRSRLLAGGATAALLVCAAFVWAALSRDAQPARRGHIEWVRAESTGELSPLAASFLAGFTGGVSELSSDGGGR